jgi:hypothetical protein
LADVAVRLVGDAAVRLNALVDVTQLFLLRKNAIAKEPGSSYFIPWRCVSRLGLANGGELLHSATARQMTIPTDN